MEARRKSVVGLGFEKIVMVKGRGKAFKVLNG